MRTAAFIPRTFVSTGLITFVVVYLFSLLFSQLSSNGILYVAMIIASSVAVIFSSFHVCAYWTVERAGKLKPPLLTPVTAAAAFILVGLAALSAAAIFALSPDGIAEPRRFWAALVSILLTTLVCEHRLWQIRRRGY